MKSSLIRMAPVLLIVLAAALLWHAQQRQGKEAADALLICPDLHQGCAIALEGRPVKVRMDGELKPLAPFQVFVVAPGAAKVEARFTMEGMDMGFNLYTLRADKAGVFQARVTLPVCVTGRRDWIMHVQVDGARLAVPFVTDL